MGFVTLPIGRSPLFFSNYSRLGRIFSYGVLIGTEQCRIGRPLLGVGLCLFSACDFDYYGHLARGQGRILWDRTPVSEIMADPQTPSKLKEQLSLVKAILAFANNLGLHTGDSYKSYYDTGGGPISWNISASPPDRFEALKWDFPIVGSLPYKGFFDKSRAETGYQKLIDAGYDAILRPVSAYSTLGYFSDPLLSSMLDHSPYELADLILHELTHGTIFVEDQVDFNESLATFIGQKGSLLFLAHHYGENTAHIQVAQQKRTDALRFRLFMVEVVSSLDRLYSLNLPKEKVLQQRLDLFADAQQHFKKTLPQYHNSNYRNFLQWKLNNARLLSYRRYHSKQEDFERVFLNAGSDMARAIAVFSTCSQQPNPWPCIESDEAPLF